MLHVYGSMMPPSTDGVGFLLASSIASKIFRNRWVMLAIHVLL